ncbi:unnamed protein product [Didymodactylos carnosus]|uniref:Glycosyl hydrolase family 13 catalytic domain-containing protein n=1 Tax=Didymodactylos carnosus TaxID=1234261 RepID=A0A815JBK7_9BILA|nr:unnamed protein product [Didymodactylos carnosus]CAF1374555.1 unnamed protein product [Didymodactylos carnosus]CAF4036819.1 unnamed protein product [Didymodactylos carnosus]CAF4263864.1 unnamed protein product [Didymodactylos carnosus]
MPSPIEFKLFAPHNIQRAKLIGTFPSWNEIPMIKNLSDGTFRCSINLEDGDYEYKYRIQKENDKQEWIDVIDPYVKHFNSDKQTGIIRIDQGKQIVDKYEWLYDNIKLPENKDLILYELYIADFTQEGTFTSAIAKLDYLQDLGINGIELLPIFETPASHTWGYTTRNYFSLKTTYGTTEDFKHLVDECHRRKIRVIIDGVYNHVHMEHSLLQIDRDYWFYHDRKHPDDPNHWGPEFNYEYHDEQLDIRPAWLFVSDVVKYYIQEYHIDGIRFDAAKQMCHYDVLEYLDQEVRRMIPNKSFYAVAEYVPDTPTITKAMHGPLDGCWRNTFKDGLVKTLCKATIKQDELQKPSYPFSSNIIEIMKTVIDGRRQGYSTSTNIVNYVSCHDNERFIYRLEQEHGDPIELFQRVRLASILLMTSFGLPMLWHGTEFGENRELGTQNPHEKQMKLQWNLLKENEQIFCTYKKLIHLRKQSPALKSDHLQFIHEDVNQKILAYVRQEDVLVIVNFTDKNVRDYQVANVPFNGTWREILEEKEYLVENNQLMTDLDSYSGLVLIKNV